MRGEREWNAERSRATPARRPSQRDLYYDAERRAADLNAAMLDLLYGINPITDAELSALIRKRPGIYGRFAGHLGKRG